MIKPIPEFPGYLISDTGIVYTALRHKKISGQWGGTTSEIRMDLPLKIKKSHVSKKWKKNITCLSKNGKKHCVYVAHLVLKAFVGPKPEGMECCHGPLGSLVDIPSNLSWGTHSKNMLDRARDGTMPRGENHRMAIFKDHDIVSIRRLYASGKYSINSLGRQFGTSHANIQSIIKRKTWKHI